MNINLLNQAKLIWAVAPANYTGAAATPKYVSLKNYGMCYVWIQTGAWAGGTAAVTLGQSPLVSAVGYKALAFDHYYSDTGTSNLLAKTTCTDTFNLGVANKQYVIPVYPGTIDGTSIGTASPFDCVSVYVASPGANDDYYSACYILTNPRNAEYTPLTAILD